LTHNSYGFLIFFYPCFLTNRSPHSLTFFLICLILFSNLWFLYSSIVKLSWFLISIFISILINWSIWLNMILIYIHWCWLAMQSCLKMKSSWLIILVLISYASIFHLYLTWFSPFRILALNQSLLFMSIFQFYSINRHI
jgi:hypothetical protein